MRRKTNTEMPKMNQIFHQFRRWLCVPLAALCLLGLLAWYMQHTTQIADGSNLTSVQGIPSHVSVYRRPRSPVQVRFTLSGQKYTYIPSRKMRFRSRRTGGFLPQSLLQIRKKSGRM